MPSSLSAGCWVSPPRLIAWRQRDRSAPAQADEQVVEHIRLIHHASRGTSGVPRVHAELASAGTRCGRQRIARLLRGAGLVGCHRRRPFHTTQRDPQAELAPDLVQRTFAAPVLNALGVADIGWRIARTCRLSMRGSGIWP